MCGMTDDDLSVACRTAVQHPENPLAIALLALVDEVERLKAIVNSLAARVAGQSEVLTRLAQRRGPGEVADSAKHSVRPFL